MTDDFVPAWLRPTRGEPRYGVSLLILVAIGLHLSLPGDVVPAPRFLLPALEVALLVGLLVANPGRMERRSGMLRIGGLVLAGLVAAANVAAMVLLLRDLLAGDGAAEHAGVLVRAAGAVWFTNVIVFTLIYWELDRGGPVERAHGTSAYPDLLFPQMDDPSTAPPDWEPNIVDYLYVSFTASTAFSPTDTMPLTRWAKLLMLAESSVSFLIVALVLARAVSLF